MVSGRQRNEWNGDLRGKGALACRRAFFYGGRTNVLRCWIWSSVANSEGEPRLIGEGQSCAGGWAGSWRSQTNCESEMVSPIGDMHGEASGQMGVAQKQQEAEAESAPLASTTAPTLN